MKHYEVMADSCSIASTDARSTTQALQQLGYYYSGYELCCEGKFVLVIL